jgi:hypothetical protein
LEAAHDAHLSRAGVRVVHMDSFGVCCGVESPLWSSVGHTVGDSRPGYLCQVPGSVATGSCIELETGLT